MFKATFSIISLTSLDQSDINREGSILLSSTLALMIHDSPDYSRVALNMYRQNRSGNLAQQSQNRSTGTGVMPGKNLAHTVSEMWEPTNTKK